MIQENKKIAPIKDDSIDVMALLKEFGVAPKIILKITLVFIFLELFEVIFSKNEYIVSTTLVPLAQGKSSGDSLGSLASLASNRLGAT